jgi:peptidoglycan/LPS O-acetylase OafA/YrhL
MMTTQTVNKSVKPERRYDVDWLRVLAVLLLFPYHTARIFDTGAPREALKKTSETITARPGETAV